MIYTSTAPGESPQDSKGDYKQWVKALGELLKPNLVINTTKYREMNENKRFFLWKSMAYKDRLETEAEFVESGLKVIDIADLRKQLHKIEKEQQKASKNTQQET